MRDERKRAREGERTGKRRENERNSESDGQRTRYHKRKGLVPY